MAGGERRDTSFFIILFHFHVFLETLVVFTVCFGWVFYVALKLFHPMLLYVASLFTQQILILMYLCSFHFCPQISLLYSSLKLSAKPFQGSDTPQQF